MYPMLGQAFGAQLVRVQSGEDFALPGRRFAGPHFAADPGDRDRKPQQSYRPGGCRASRLAAIVEAAPDAAVLIDEAYFEFCGETVLAELPRHPNLFVARTFSKAYGLAGLRLGVLIGAAGAD